MDIKNLITIITASVAALVAIVSALITVYGQARLAKYTAKLDIEKDSRKKHELALQIFTKFRDPLLYSAYELQSRLFNILQQNLLYTHYIQGDDLEREYTIQNTLYVVAQYLCWREIIRQEVQYLDVGNDELSLKLTELLDNVDTLFLTNRIDKTFRIFRGEQRAIGEKLIIKDNGKSGCMGYATFVNQKDDSFRRWFIKLENDILKLSAAPGMHDERLLKVQHALIDLLDFLDPDLIRFQKKFRKKVTVDRALV